MPSKIAFSLYVLLGASGASGLVYEVCWSRQLGLWLGRGERGAAATLALFFLGMALGYAWAARSIASVRRPLLAYGVCELVVAASAFLLPLLTRMLSPTDGALLWVSLLLPTVAMGASLPFALEAVSATSASLSSAYAFHLMGAASGSLLCTFVTIERLGVFQSTRVFALLSAACGLLAVRLSSSTPSQSSRVEDSAKVGWHFKLAAAWAGAMTLALEVLSLRLFALTFHNSTYTFGLTISVFIVYLALGSRWYERLLLRAKDPREAVFRAARRAAVGVLLMAPLFALVTRYGSLRAPTFVAYVILSAVLVLVVLALPVMASGALLPGLWGMVQGRPGQTVGSLSAYNGVGAACGALFASHVLLPRFGLLTSLSLVALAFVVLAIALRVRVASAWMSGALVLALAFALGPVSRIPEPPGYRVLERWQTPQGLLDLVQSKKDRSLSARLDLHYQLGSSADRARHRLMGELPLTLKEQPTDVLFVGLATGMTASVVRAFPMIERVEVVELVAEVTALARRFGEVNDHVLDDPRVRVTIDDGRAYFAKTDHKFDVVVSDLFVPWHSHAGYLYTVEHFRAVKEHLKQEGLFAQWLPLWQLGEDELELIMNSFCAVFPHAEVWLDARDDERVLLALMSKRTRASVPGLSASRVYALSRCDRTALNTDERPRLEFRAPRAEQDQRLLLGARVREYVKRRFAVVSP